MKKKPATANETQIGNLLQRYKKNLKPPQSTIEKMVVETIKTKYGFTLSQDKVTYTVATKTIHLHIPSVMRSELKPHYRNILEDIRNKTGEASAPQTIF